MSALAALFPFPNFPVDLTNVGLTGEVPPLPGAGTDETEADFASLLASAFAGASQIQQPLQQLPLPTTTANISPSGSQPISVSTNLTPNNELLTSTTSISGSPEQPATPTVSREVVTQATASLFANTAAETVSSDGTTVATSPILGDLSALVDERISATLPFVAGSTTIDRASTILPTGNREAGSVQAGDSPNTPLTQGQFSNAGLPQPVTPLPLPTEPATDPVAREQQTAERVATATQATLTQTESTNNATTRTPSPSATNGRTSAVPSLVPGPSVITTPLVDPNAPPPVAPTGVDKPPEPVRPADSIQTLQTRTETSTASARDRFGNLIASRPDVGTKQPKLDSVSTTPPARFEVPVSATNPDVPTTPPVTTTAPRSELPPAVQLVDELTGQPLNRLNERRPERITNRSTTRFVEFVMPPTTSMMPVNPADRLAMPTEVQRVSVAGQAADSIIVRAELIEREGSTEFRMRLDPPELGQMEVRVHSANGKLHADLTVADESVRHLVESQLSELKQRLETAGFQVDGFTLSSQDFSKNQDRRQREPFEVPELPPPPRRPQGQAPKPIATMSRAVPGGLLDVTA